MLLDGHSAKSIVDRLGLSGTNILYRWKSDQLKQSGPVASSLEARVRELEIELRRVERFGDHINVATEITKACRDGSGPVVHPGRAAMVVQTVNTKKLELSRHIIPFKLQHRPRGDEVRPSRRRR
jgi:transposase